MVFATINVCIIYFGEVLVERVRLHRRCIIPSVLVMLAITAVLPSCTSYLRRHAAVSMMETVFQQLAEGKDIRPWMDPPLAGDFPLEAYYSMPLTWDRSYFSSGWSNGHRFRIECTRTSTRADQIVRATPRYGTTIFDDDPNNLGNLSISLFLDNGKWNPIYDVSIFYRNGKWMIADFDGLRLIMESIITDMETPGLRQCYTNFYQSYIKKNSGDLIDTLCDSTAERVLRTMLDTSSSPPRRVRLDACLSVQSILGSRQLPMPDDIGQALWEGGRMECWFAVNSTGRFGLKMPQSGTDDGAVLYFEKSPNRKEWKIRLRNYYSDLY